jgi:peptide/nickel transport system permease protein
MRERGSLVSIQMKSDQTATAPSTPTRAILRRLARNKGAMVGGAIVLLFLLTALLGPFISPHDPLEQVLSLARKGPSIQYLLGTDHLGRDVLSRLIHGARVSLLIGLASVAGGSAVGTALGLVAGYYGGWVDSLVMRLLDIQLAFPGLLLAITIISILGPGLANTIIAVTVWTIPGFARITRSTVVTLRGREFVEAATALGQSDWGIMWKHILPNSLSPLIVQASLSIGTVILTASGLSFLGLGVQAPDPEWGAMLASSRQYLLDNPISSVAPGVCITLVVLSFSLLGDGLRDALDPRMKL